MMFADFKKAFFKKNEAEKKIPSEVLNSLNEKLPTGFEYIDLGDGAVGLTVEGAQPDISGLNLRIPKELKKVIKNYPLFTFKELLELIYRAQMKIEILPTENESIKINGHAMKFDDIVKYPIDDLKISANKSFLIPQPFQPAFYVSIEGIGIRKEIQVQRQPLADMDKSIFKSIKPAVFELSYILDEKKESITFKCRLNGDQAVTVKDLLEGMKLYYSFLMGEFKLAGMPLSKMILDNKVDTEEEEVFKETITLWEKVHSLEQAIKVRFKPQSDIDNNSMYWIEKLYKSIILNEPYKLYVTINELSIQTTEVIKSEDFLSNEGLMFYFINSEEIEVLDTRFTIHSVNAIFDFKVIDFKDKFNSNKEYILEVKPINENGIYQSFLHFFSEEEALSYKVDIKILQNADEF